MAGRKVTGTVALVQKTMTLSKSRPASATVSEEGGSFSRKMRQDGKTSLMVLITMPNGGSVKSPA